MPRFKYRHASLYGTALYCSSQIAAFFTNWRQDNPPAKRLRLTLLRLSLHCSGLGLNLQYLRSARTSFVALLFWARVFSSHNEVNRIYFKLNETDYKNTENYMPNSVYSINGWRGKENPRISNKMICLYIWNETAEKQLRKILAVPSALSKNQWRLAW